MARSVSCRYCPIGPARFRRRCFGALLQQTGDQLLPHYRPSTVYMDCCYRRRRPLFGDERTLDFELLITAIIGCIILLLQIIIIIIIIITAVTQTVGLGKTRYPGRQVRRGIEPFRRTTEGDISGRSFASQWRLASGIADHIIVDCVWTTRQSVLPSLCVRGSTSVHPIPVSVAVLSTHGAFTRTGVQTCIWQICETPRP